MSYIFGKLSFWLSGNHFSASSEASEFCWQIGLNFLQHLRPYRTYFDKYLNPPQTVIGPPTRGRPGPSDNDDDDEEDADDGDDDYMVGLETWWGKRAARAGRASMTNPQATLPYTDQVHLVDLYKDIAPFHKQTL